MAVKKGGDVALHPARERVADRPGEGDGVRICLFFAMLILLNATLTPTLSRLRERAQSLARYVNLPGH